MIARSVRPVCGALGALLFMAACQVETLPAPKRSAQPGRPTQAASQASPAPAVRAPELLRPPPGEVARLKGVVSVDAGYMVAAGAGNLHALQGAPLVAAGAGNLIGPDGASLIGADGATLVAAGGGNIVAAGGLNLIGADGASLVGADAASFKLAQASPAAGIGDVLPAAAMRVGVIDLRDGKPVPIGVDSRGEPVYSVYSDLAGGYELFVPRSLAGYVRIVAEAAVADERLVYDAIVRADAAPDDIDEDTARLGRFLRSVFAIRFEQMMAMTRAELEAELEAPRALDPNKPEYFQTYARPMLIFFADMSERRGFAVMDPVKRRAIAQIASDRLLAACDFSNVRTADQVPSYVPADPNELALDAFRDSMKRIRLDARPLLEAQGEVAFSARLLELASRRLTGVRPYPIKKPADLAAFIVRAFLSDRREGVDIGGSADTERILHAEGLLDELGILSPEDRSGRLRAAGLAVVYHMLYVLKFQDNADPANQPYSPVGQGIIDYLWTVETGVASAQGRPDPRPAAGGP